MSNISYKFFVIAGPQGAAIPALGFFIFSDGIATLRFTALAMTKKVAPAMGNPGHID